jgi:tRNA pseudouridine13 synthase
VLGEAPPPRDRKLARLYVSALQSELFNAWLAARLADGLYARVIAGDILHLARGGQFVCEDPAVDEPRLVAGELVATGPMFGARMRRPPHGSLAAAREDAILVESKLPPDAIDEGTRRDAAIAVRDVDVFEATENAFEVCFTLPGGAYATAVMREVMKQDD